MQRLVYQNAVYVRIAEVQEYLYHVTFVRNIESLQQHGLAPGGRANWQTYDVAGKLFFTSAGGVRTWLHKVSYIARDTSDTEVEDGLVPIVLRIRETAVKELVEDVEGSRDGGADAFYTHQSVKPENIELFDSSAWVPLENVDEYEIRDYAVNNSKHEIDGDEEYILLDEDMFLPPELK